MSQPTAAHETLVGSKLTDPIGSHQPTDKSSYQNPPWYEAGLVAISRPRPRVTVLQWLRHAASHVRSRTLEQDKRTFAGFTCVDCPNREKRHRQDYYSDRLLWSWLLGSEVRWRTIYPERCKECNTKYSRFKRARRAMTKIHERGMDIWFITLTRPNITGVPPFPHVQEIDRDMWIKDFKRFRRTKIWKDTFAGGYWFYEFTSHSKDDKIFAKDGTFIRQATDDEINGHLHILATTEGRIPMKEIAAQWGDRVDFRKPKAEKDVFRYLKGYLVKCSTQGVNMRPFGDIHRRKEDGSSM